MTTAISCCHSDIITALTALVNTVHASNSQTDSDAQRYIVHEVRRQFHHNFLLMLKGMKTPSGKQ